MNLITTILCKWLWGFTRILIHEKTPMAIVIVTAIGETPFNNLKLMNLTKRFVRPLAWGWDEASRLDIARQEKILLRQKLAHFDSRVNDDGYQGDDTSDDEEPIGLRTLVLDIFSDGVRLRDGVVRRLV